MRALVLGWLVAVGLTTSPARADDKAACLDAASKGQALRDQHKLVEAREQFRRCAVQQCPAMVVQDCGGWLSDVEKSLPTVVITAKDGAGNDLVDVQVTLDGQPLLTKLDGGAVPANPGMHTFHFETREGARLDWQALIKQGDKNQELAVVLGAPPGTPVAAPSATPELPGAAGRGNAETGTPAPATSSGTWKTMGWVLGGLGVAGIAVGTVFGLVSMNDKNNAHCDAHDFCDPDSLASGRSAATGADVGFIAGGALLAGGVACLLLAPSGTAAGAGALRVAPLIGRGGGGATIGGSWQ